MCEASAPVVAVVTERPLGLNTNGQFDHLIAPIAALAAEPLERVVNRLVTKEGVPLAYAEAMRVEFLRFVALKLVYPRQSASPSPAVDQFWHAFILFTRDYAAFGERHFGSFLHHEPNDGLSDRTLRPGAGRRTAQRVLEVFPECNRQLWELPACCDDDCDDVGCDPMLDRVPQGNACGLGMCWDIADTAECAGGCGTCDACGLMQKSEGCSDNCGEGPNCY